VKGRNSFKRDYCKLKSIAYTSPFDAEVIRKTGETNILPPHEIVEIETNKYLVDIEFYRGNEFFYGMLKEKFNREKEFVLCPYDFLQFRKKGSKEWRPLVFSDSDAISVLGFLPDKFRRTDTTIRWEKMKRTALEEAIEKACGEAEDEMDEILNFA